MVVDVAKIKGAEGIFSRDDIWLQKKQDAKMFGAGALAPIFKAEMKTIIRGMKHASDKPDKAKLRVGFVDLLTNGSFSCSTATKM